MKLTVRMICAFTLVVTLAAGAHAGEALRKMTVGQAGVNPGAGLFTIAVNQGFYKKHGLDVEIIKTNTTAAVQAMLAGKMQMATGAGAGRGVRHCDSRRSAAVCTCGLMGERLSVQDHGAQGHQKNRRP
jgi:ABC-type proline/glycine betaine transport system substrate-binding protein